jgi:capsular polysaccharide export protein
MSLNAQRFLFLQGLASPFFRELGKEFRRQGASVDRVNFRRGDKMWWSGPAVDFRRRLSELPAFYEKIFRQKRITDVVLFGDMRPVHRPVHTVAAEHGARVHVFEEGYIRPNWITVEREGVNLNSPLPRDPDWYRKAEKLLPTDSDAEAVHVPMALRAGQDLAYRLASTLDPVLFPYYRTHRPRRAITEYAGWTLRYAKFPFLAKGDRSRLESVFSSAAPTFLLPLQLNGDSQILHHSRFDSVAEVIGHVITSFAKHAPLNARLLIKNHPLDPGLDDHQSVVKKNALDEKVADRVAFVETTNLAEIFPRINGVVLVNSTTGLSAIWRGIPVHTLADPVYNMPGLTHQGTLEAFWSTAQTPDLELYNAFRRVLLHVNHINGDYFTTKGIALAVVGAPRFFNPVSPLEELLTKVPLGGVQTGREREGAKGLVARC